jgi:hypothetical protein
VGMVYGILWEGVGVEDMLFYLIKRGGGDRGLW